VMVENLESKEAAFVWLNQHKKTIAA